MPFDPRHRSRTLQMQQATCETARTPEGRAFIVGARGARYVEIEGEWHEIPPSTTRF